MGSASEVGFLGASWLRALRAENASSNTIHTYHAALTQLQRFLVETGRPTDVDEIDREDVIRGRICRPSGSGSAERSRPPESARRSRVVLVWPAFPRSIPTSSVTPS